METKASKKKKRLEKNELDLSWIKITKGVWRKKIMNIKIKVSNSNNYTVGEQAQWEKKKQIAWKVSNYCIYTQKCMLNLHNAKRAPHKFSAQQIQSIVMKTLLKSTHLAVLNQQNWVKLDVIAWSMNALR